MNRLRIAGMALLTMLLLAAGHAVAETLTEQDVKNFINSLEALQELEGEFAELADDMNQEPDNGDPAIPDLGHLFSDAVGRMEGHPQFEQFSAIVKDNGFGNASDWGETGDRVFRAWMAIEMQGQSRAAHQDVANAIAEIDRNPSLTAEQKAQMKAMMQGAMSMMEQASDAPEADIRALRPHMEELRRVTSEDN
ncbi:hypothetical protein [Marinobacter mobilis]|uniref:LTXXQ motif family protein n=1 Tax=Marinobacter mobilis TaxID=488533 RepID=A0A1H2Y9G2_9GAMM|nr:hypothetical protein [Marinobacter mobilis]SDX01863.1 hypothetical protein SAMN04487960_105307 [Marinobacter mobilis]SDX49348.1 hypothetical protein SAMN04487960_11037 [Marinobacter mobilis]